MARELDTHNITRTVETLCNVLAQNEKARERRDDLFCGECMPILELEQDATEVDYWPDPPSPAVPITRNISYADYLKSDHWQHMRQIAREHYGNCCCLCG